MSDKQPPTRPTYTDEELQGRVKAMSNHELIYSNQYGMRFILNRNNEILLNISALIAPVGASCGRSEGSNWTRYGLGNSTETMPISRHSGQAVDLVPEDCTLIAHNTGEGWYLAVQNRDGDDIAILKWPWGNKGKNAQQLEEYGYEII